MPKVTQNRVYNDDGSTVQLDGKAESVVGYLSKLNALRFVQATVKETDAEGKITKRPLFNEDGSPKMIARPRDGYTQYWNNDGFTDPMSPERLSPQGVGKLMSKLLEVAHMITRNGGAKGDEMKAILAGVFAYHEIADVEVGKATENAAMEEALSVLKKATKGDAAAAQAKLSEFLKSKGINAPAPTLSEVTQVALEEPSVTVAEAAEAAAELVEIGEIEPTEPTAIDETLTVEEN